MKKYKHFSDIQLIHCFQNGEADALEQLIFRYKERIFSSIIYLVKDKYLAEDIFQETFVKIIDTLRHNRYNEEGKFISWALCIAHNLCIDYFRKIKRKPPIVTSNNQNLLELLYTGSENAEEKTIRFEKYESLHSLLNKLPLEQREVIVLRHFGDMSFKEIARLTHCSINTALGRMRYGLMNLRKMLAEEKSFTLPSSSVL
jgi:RNA polymerase sigma-70 factor (ECF subfamily)